MNKKSNYLAYLLKSKTRSAILTEMILNRQKRFYMRELERLLKISVGNIRRELNNLAWQGLVKAEKVGNLKFYSINKQNPIYNPIKELVNKTSGIPKLLEFYLRPNKHVIVSFIYGSYARGNFDAESDIDLFIIITTDNERVFEEINNHLDKLESRFGREINIDTMSKQEFFTRINKKDPFVMDLIKSPKLFIKGGKNDIRSSKA